MADQDEVLKASDRFYSALDRLTNGDASAMADVWSHRGDVTAMHAFGGRQSGWDDVWSTWEQMSRSVTQGRVRVTQQQLRVLGDVAYTTGIEQVEVAVNERDLRFETRVTNIFRREGGDWKLVHHHADASPAARAALLTLDPNL